MSRATIHRWWPTKTDLLREALTLHTHALVVTDTGVWADDVRTMALRFAAFFDDPVEVSLNSLMASGAHPDFNEAVLGHYEALFGDWRDLVQRARERGAVVEDVDADTLLLTLSSPLLLVPLLFRRSVRPAQVDRLVDLVLRASTGAAPAG